MSVLTEIKHVKREIFDPENSAHVASLKHFLRTGNWGEIQFEAELPYIEVPMTVVMKYARWVLNVEVETAGQRDARLDGNVIRQQKTPASYDLQRANELMSAALGTLH